jgi:hypothetical protein
MGLDVRRVESVVRVAKNIGVALPDVLEGMSHTGSHRDLHRFARVEGTFGTLTSGQVLYDNLKTPCYHAEHLRLVTMDVIRPYLTSLAFNDVHVKHAPPLEVVVWHWLEQVATLVRKHLNVLYPRNPREGFSLALHEVTLSPACAHY